LSLEKWKLDRVEYAATSRLREPAVLLGGKFLARIAGKRRNKTV
jgi:hypothetical protein